MSRRHWPPMVAVVLASLAVLLAELPAAAQVRDGVKFNPAASGIRTYVRRSVDSTGTTAGKVDSAVLILPAQSMPMLQAVGGMYAADTTGRVLRFDASGNLLSSEANKDRDNWSIPTGGIINDTMSVAALANGRVSSQSSNLGFCAESTLVLPCGQYRHFTLFMRAIPIGAATSDTSSMIRVAVEIRKHTTNLADTSSTFVWMSWEPPAGTNAPTGPDSLGHTYAGVTIGSTPGTVALYPGEHEFIFDPRRRGDRNTDYFFGPPDGIAVDLVDAHGQWFWAPYMSVRIRVLSYTSSAANDHKPRIYLAVGMGS